MERRLGAQHRVGLVGLGWTTYPAANLGTNWQTGLGRGGFPPKLLGVVCLNVEGIGRDRFHQSSEFIQVLFFGCFLKRCQPRFIRMKLDI